MFLAGHTIAIFHNGNLLCHKKDNMFTNDWAVF